MRAALLVAAALASTASAIRDLPGRLAAARHPRLRVLDPAAAVAAPSPSGRPGMANCTQRTFEQRVDHFSWSAPPAGNGTFQQRWCFNADSWNRAAGGAIFFYAGNEADYTLYVNAVGLMWENAAARGALLVWAEHRYYGESLPFGAASQQFPQYQTHEQAQADYARLAYALSDELGEPAAAAQPVILFGGSYGGMLAAWTRMKFPGVFAGAVAACEWGKRGAMGGYGGGGVVWCAARGVGRRPSTHQLDHPLAHPAPARPPRTTPATPPQPRPSSRSRA